MSHSSITRRTVTGLVVVILILLLGVVPYVRASGPWYVAVNGNDANTCMSPVAPCGTINGALAKASADDVIYVGAGTYTSVEWFVVEISKPIILSGGWNSDFNRQVDFSVIDGQKLHPGAYITASGTVVMDHFIIQNGRSDSLGGGGFEVFNANLIMTNCAVRNNIGSGIGGGAYVASSLTMDNCSLTGNQEIFGDGGAIRVGGGVNLNNVTIHDNYAPAGGALSVSGAVSITGL